MRSIVDVKNENIKDEQPGLVSQMVSGGQRRERFTFERFVVGAGNQLEYAVAQQIAEGREISLSPVYIYGDRGLGKTHLLHAIANAIHENGSTCNYLYTTAEKYTNDLIAALRNGKIQSSKKR